MRRCGCRDSKVPLGGLCKTTNFTRCNIDILYSRRICGPKTFLPVSPSVMIIILYIFLKLFVILVSTNIRENLSLAPKANEISLWFNISCYFCCFLFFFCVNTAIIFFPCYGKTFLCNSGHVILNITYYLHYVFMK